MIRKGIAILLVPVLALALMACGAGKETTLSGMVVSVEGSVISLVEMDAGDMDMNQGQMPQMPEGMEDFAGFDPESFDPESFDGTFDRGQMPQDMELPEGMTMPEFDGEMPEIDGEMPEFDGEMPEFDGEMPEFDGGNGGRMPGFGNMETDAQTTQVDIADAHISVEIDGGKASGTMEDIQAGTFVTVTVNGKGEATNVLVSAQSFFGGFAN